MHPPQKLIYQQHDFSGGFAVLGEDFEVINVSDKFNAPLPLKLKKLRVHLHEKQRSEPT
jgi:hypothetical protein